MFVYWLRYHFLLKVSEYYESYNAVNNWLVYVKQCICFMQEKKLKYQLRISVLFNALIFSKLYTLTERFTWAECINKTCISRVGIRYNTTSKISNFIGRAFYFGDRNITIII